MPAELVEPNYPMISQLGLLGSRCLVYKVPVIRLANVSSRPIKVAKDSSIAFITDPNMLLQHPEPAYTTEGITYQQSIVCDE